VALRAKELRFAVELTADGELREEHGVGLAVPPDWSPEHLLLAALVRCSLQSLRHHAGRHGLEVRSAAASARTLVTRRESDGRYALVETALELVVEVAPEPAPDALDDLLDRAERDCFVGASLTSGPTYRWTVNGRTIAA
jgi:organic hydroperoxide reductase OsmC/OhrA